MHLLGVCVLFGVLCGGLCCPDGWLAHTGKCYLFSRDTENWADATVMCKNMKGQLVEIESVDENNYLKTTAKLKGSRSYWIGLWDLQEEGTWTWLTSDIHLSAETFSDWLPGQPNNHDNHEDCAMLSASYHWQWIDSTCHDQHYFICERDEPSSGQVIG